jgi:hypothetical protein
MNQQSQKRSEPGQAEDLGGLEVLSSTALRAQTSAEIDIAIATAHRFPRSIKTFQSKVETMATIDQDTAAACFYKLPRKNEDGSIKTIEGPSIRFAEIVANAYRNLRHGSRIVEIGDTHVVAQGLCHDLEENVQNMSEVRRRIVGKNGRRYSEDMIITTCNAACSIAIRNAIFKTVPIALAKKAMMSAKKCAVGTAKTITQRRAAAIAKFAEINVTEKMILEKLELHSVEDITLEYLEILIGLYTAISEGTTSAAEEFGATEPMGTGKPVTEPPKARAPAAASGAPLTPLTPRGEWLKKLRAEAEKKGVAADMESIIFAEFNHETADLPETQWDAALKLFSSMQTTR